jgi:flagellar motor switch protein FliG
MATPSGSGTLTGAQKAAILMIALGDQASASLLNQLSEEQVQAVSAAIADLSSVTSAEAEAVLQEFRDATADVARVGPGGIAYAKRILTSAFGPEGSRKHLELLPGARGAMGGTRQLQSVEPQLLARFVKSEHPQTVAIVLSQLNPAQSASILASMEPAARADIAFRIAKLDKISPAVVSKISAVIGQKLKSLGEIKRQPSGGPRAVAEIFNQLNTELSNEILTQMGDQNPELIESIRQKMFVFDDLMALDANGVKELLSRADRRQLTTALKGTNEELRQHLLKGMSQRGAAMLLEDMEALGPVKIREVEAAQQALIAVLRQLESEGVLSLKGGGGDDQYVV